MNYISRYRKKLGLTQTDLAKELGCTKGNISHYENGRRKADLEVCRQLVSFFNNKGINVTIDDIFPPKVWGGDQSCTIWNWIEIG
ncbi:TPA: helix-turn-helix transcriptional regulator [Providencia alcalifaciens]